MNEVQNRLPVVAELPELWGWFGSGSADAVAAFCVAAVHGLMFCREDGDMLHGVTFAQSMDEVPAEPTSTRQHSALNALQVGQDVLPDVHGAFQQAGRQARADR